MIGWLALGFPCVLARDAAKHAWLVQSVKCSGRQVHSSVAWGLVIAIFWQPQSSFAIPTKLTTSDESSWTKVAKHPRCCRQARCPLIRTCLKWQLNRIDDPFHKCRMHTIFWTCLLAVSGWSCKQAACTAFRTFHDQVSWISWCLHLALASTTAALLV